MEESSATKGKPTFPPGSILRVAWPDEIFPDESEEYQVYENDGLGIEYYDSIEPLMKQETSNNWYSLLPMKIGGIPYNTRGLLYLDWWQGKKDEGEDWSTWYQVLYNEKVVWILSRNLVLVKRGTEE